MDKHPITTNPSLSLKLLDATIAGHSVLVYNSKPEIFENVCPKGIRRWVVISVVDPQNHKILDDKVQVEREAI